MKERMFFEKEEEGVFTCWKKYHKIYRDHE